ncbi:hypothetical protein ILP97_42620 [Amycolatopsis sp. H6(2020)]|nr:hypothetical protein [Amycolatopsis sp. H6(2020)]
MSSKTTTESALLDRAIRDKLIAVVVDANAYGEVGPNLARLAALARDLAKIRIKTWVPEPVAWEWAEHLAAQWILARNFVKEPLRHLTAAGLPTLAITPGYADRDAVIEAFLAALDAVPHLEVIALTAESAIAGLKDQILQQAPAKTKSQDKVKTGGSDSAWLRDVLQRADGPDSLLFLSRDKDIIQAYDAWKLGKPLMRASSEVRSALFDYVPAGIDDQWLVARLLSSLVPVALGEATQVPGQLVGKIDGLLDALDLDWEEHGWTGGDLTRLTGLAGLQDVVCEPPELHEPGKQPDTRTLRATAFFLADAEITHAYRLDDDEPVVEETFSRTGLVARTTLVAKLQSDKLIEVRPDSDTIVFTGGTFEDSWDAFEAIDDALTGVPGLVLPDKWGGWQTAGEVQIPVEGTDHTAELSWNYGENGGFSLVIDDAEAEVTRGYDDETWVGGSDGFNVEPPYYLTVDTPEIGGGGAWHLASWMIHGLQPTAKTPASGDSGVDPTSQQGESSRPPG